MQTAIQTAQNKVSYGDLALNEDEIFYLGREETIRVGRVDEGRFYEVCIFPESDHDRHESLAYAKLFAAAPDLLKALQFIAAMQGKTLLNLDLGEDGDRAHQIGANAAFNQLAEVARAALAKAS